MRIGTISLALLAVVGVMAGCGSSNSSSSGKTGSSNAAATSASSGASTTSSGTPTFASTSHCSALTSLGSKYVKELSNPASAGTLSFSTLLKADQAMADASPSAIHSDAEYVVHAFAGFVNTLTNTGYKLGSAPTPSQLSALESAEATFKAPQFTAAVNHIKAWVDSNCHA